MLLLLTSVLTWAQESNGGSDLANGKYVIDNQYAFNFGLLKGSNVLNVSDLEEEDVLNVENTKSEIVNLPFLGLIYRNKLNDIYQLEVTEPLMRYGKRRVLLDRKINIQAPSTKSIVTGYRMVFVPDEIDQSTLNQLPIRPDSIRVSIQVKITDSSWSDISLNYKASKLGNRSFLRKMAIEKSVDIKVEPFGWTPVNNIAPMIDWDRNFNVEHRYFIADDLDIPYAILENRSGSYNLAVLDFKRSGGKPRVISGAPEIKAFPNPVINDVRFEISNVPKGNYLIKIKNILGETKIQKSVQLSAIELFPVKIDDLRKGSYFYVLEDDKGNVLSTKRLIVLKP